MVPDLSRVRRLGNKDRRSWHGSAFIVEALVLLAFLGITLAVLVQLMGVAHNKSVEANQLSSAITLASNNAEEFYANPGAGSEDATFARVDGKIAPVTETAPEDGSVLKLVRAVTSESQPAGTLFSAHISISNDAGDVIYEVETARYVSSGGMA